ncbi:MAG: hypothetical protein R3A50_11715 [Saprospiraceae bacterium]|nr:hypothetical protein [Lewinellaceae bacterium]
MEENNDLERISYTHENWLDGTLPWSMWWFKYGESGVFHEPENVTKIHVLPESEYQKIVDKQEAILADHVSKNLAYYIQRFEERLAAPGEHDKRIEDEIQEIDKILTDKTLTLVPVWYNQGQAYASGVVGMSPSGGQHVSRDFKNEIAYWYNQIIIKADPYQGVPRIFIMPEDDGNYSRYIPQVAVLVFYQYRQYLLNLTGFDIERFTFLDTNPPKGKVHYKLCCVETDKIFEGLRKYKPSREEFFMFKDSFNEHPFADYDRLRKELPKLVDDIFDRAAKLRPDLQAYFLEAMEQDVVDRIKGNSTLINERLNFQKLFKAKMTAMQEAEEKRLAEMEQDENPTESNTGFTTAQSVLAIFYLLKAANFDRGKGSDLLYAQFVQSITGKEPNPKIKNTTILKRWRGVIDERKMLNPDDVEIVKSWFEKMGLDEIAELINKRKRKRKNSKE